MKIIDENGNEIFNPDLRSGYLKEDTIIEHHEAVEGAEEQWHYETIAEYPNGGKEVTKVVDVPGVKEKEAWDEEIPVKRYVLYTPEELAKIEEERNKPTQEQRISTLEEALEMILAGVTE